MSWFSRSIEESLKDMNNETIKGLRQRHLKDRHMGRYAIIKSLEGRPISPISDISQHEEISEEVAKAKRSVYQSRLDGLGG